MATVGDTEALADELAIAMSRPARDAVLQGAVANKVRFDRIATQVGHLLRLWDLDGRKSTKVPGLWQQYTILWGPWRVDDIDREWNGETVTDYAPIPAIGSVKQELPDARVVICVVIWAKGRIARAILGTEDRPIHLERIAATLISGTWIRHELYFAVPITWFGTVLELRSYDDGGRAVHARQLLSVHKNHLTYARSQ